jgi:hypothetical protein
MTHQTPVRHHAAEHVEVLDDDDDHGVVARQGCRQLVQTVLAQVPDAGMQAGDLPPRFRTVLAALRLACMLPLKPHQLLEVPTQGLRPLDFAAVADHGQVRDADPG